MKINDPAREASKLSALGSALAKRVADGGQRSPDLSANRHHSEAFPAGALGRIAGGCRPPVSVGTQAA